MREFYDGEPAPLSNLGPDGLMNPDALKSDDTPEPTIGGKLAGRIVGQPVISADRLSPEEQDGLKAALAKNDKRAVEKFWTDRSRAGDSSSSGVAAGSEGGLQSPGSSSDTQSEEEERVEAALDKLSEDTGGVVTEDAMLLLARTSDRFAAVLNAARAEGRDPVAVMEAGAEKIRRMYHGDERALQADVAQITAAVKIYEKTVGAEKPGSYLGDGAMLNDPATFMSLRSMAKVLLRRTGK